MRVNAVSPGFIVTEMTRTPLEGMGLTRYIASRTPMRRVGEAREVAAAVLFLASDEASYITGTNLNVDGGTNAANGYYQVEPVHHHWNAETKPRVGSTYSGLVDQPDFLAQWRKGIRACTSKPAEKPTVSSRPPNRCGESACAWRLERGPRRSEPRWTSPSTDGH